MIPKPETPLIRVERDIAWLKSLPTIMISAVRPRGILRLGPWSELDGATQDLVLDRLDWSGVDWADRGRIEEREIKPSSFNPFCRSKERAIATEADLLAGHIGERKVKALRSHAGEGVEQFQRRLPAPCFFFQ